MVLERDPSRLAHFEIVQGGFFYMKKYFDKCVGDICSDSAIRQGSNLKVIACAEAKKAKLCGLRL